MSAVAAMPRGVRSLSFFVPGVPKAAGSKRAFIVRAKGRPDRVAVADASGQPGRDWRAVLQLAAREAHGGAPLDGPLRVVLAFSLPRPKSHLGKRGLLPSAPAYPTVKPDIDKLSRACLDAMKAIVYRDDAQIVTKTATKLYASAEGPGVLVEVEEIA